MKNSQYFIDSNKYFQPLDEIVEALRNDEGISGFTNKELWNIVTSNEELKDEPQIKDILIPLNTHRN